MRIGIVGGGVAGLAAAYFLSEQGHQVDVFEQAPELGGLAGSVEFAGLRVEKYYHFVCRDDTDLIDLLPQLQLSDELEWRPGSMRFFYQGQLYPFGTPWDLLRFRPLSLLDRLRFGWNVAIYRSATGWQRLEGYRAREWLESRFGTRTYQVIWDPLLRMKFGSFADEVTAAWMWHRIHRLARSRPHMLAREQLGFLKRGTDVLLARLIDILSSRGVGLHVSTPVEHVSTDADRVSGLHVAGNLYPYNAIVSTAPLPVLARLLPASQARLRDQLDSIAYLAVVCVLLRLRHALTDGFWVNVHDPDVSFNGFVEYTNLNPRQDAGAPHLVYVPFYLPPGDPRFQWPDAEFVAACVEGLRRVRPGFDNSQVLAARVFRDRFAQAICTVNFSGRIPPIRAPLTGLFLTDSTQLYPSDRTISGMIGLAHRVAREINSSRTLET